MPGTLRDVSEPVNQQRRWSRIAAVALGVWVLVLIFGWALRPIEDTVPVEVDPDSALAALLADQPAITPVDPVRAQLVECNSLVETPARDPSVALPTLPDDHVYTRTPCVSPHAGARLAAAANVIAVIALVIAWAWFARRFRLDAATEPVPTTTSAW